MGVGNYFGVNYGNHYRCAQNQYQQSSCCPPSPRPQYGCGTPSYGHSCGGYQGGNPFRYIMSMFQQLFGAYQNQPPVYQPPKMYSSEGPSKYAIYSEGPVGKLVAGPGEGPGSWMSQMMPFADMFAGF